MKYIITIVLAAFMFTSCKTIQKTGTTSLPEIGYEAKGCFGRCPIEKFQITSAGSLAYEGKRNVKRIGKYSGKVSSQKHADLIQVFKDNNFDNLNNEYLSTVRDLPKFSIRLGNKTIEFQERSAPKELKNILAELKEFIKNKALTQE